MCDPTTALLVSGLVLTGTGQITQGIAQKKAADANAHVQRIMATDALERGKAKEASQRRKTAALKGKQAAMFGASGGEVNTGSALEILADTAQFGELDALRIRNNAERESFAHLSSASISEAQGKNARTAGIIKGVGTLITAGTAVSGKWDAFKADNPDSGASFGDFLTGNT